MDEPRDLVEQAFNEWMTGTGYISRIFAPDMRWEIVGRSAASARYENAAEFIERVLEPFGRRFGETEPFRPVAIRALYADGPTVIVIWDGAGRTLDDTVYENTYVWVLTLRNGLVVDGLALFDSIAFNELWSIQPKG